MGKMPFLSSEMESKGEVYGSKEDVVSDVEWSVPCPAPAAAKKKKEQTKMIRYERDPWHPQTETKRMECEGMIRT